MALVGESCRVVSAQHRLFAFHFASQLAPPEWPRVLYCSRYRSELRLSTTPHGDARCRPAPRRLTRLGAYESGVVVASSFFPTLPSRLYLADTVDSTHPPGPPSVGERLAQRDSALRHRLDMVLWPMPSSCIVDSECPARSCVSVMPPRASPEPWPRGHVRDQKGSASMGREASHRGLPARHRSQLLVDVGRALHHHVRSAHYYVSQRGGAQQWMPRMEYSVLRTVTCFPLRTAILPMQLQLQRQPLPSKPQKQPSSSCRTSRPRPGPAAKPRRLIQVNDD